MASPEKVKRYLAYWFQLGKKLIINNGKESILPKNIISGNSYTQEFEECWQKVNNLKTSDCYLENTKQTIQQLLSSQWDISPCARCEMPVPIIQLGISTNICTCDDLDNWPNNELPYPRSPVDSKNKLNNISKSLIRKNN